MDNISKKILEVDHIKSLLMDFKYNLKSYIYIQEELEDINEQLRGLPSAPRIKSKEEAFYKYERDYLKNPFNLELLSKEEELVIKRDQHSSRIKEALTFISKLDNEEIMILDMIYYQKCSISKVADTICCDKTTVYRKLDKIWLIQ